jgi:hypothetical protein
MEQKQNKCLSCQSLEEALRAEKIHKGLQSDIVSMLTKQPIFKCHDAVESENKGLDLTLQFYANQLHLISKTQHSINLKNYYMTRLKVTQDEKSVWNFHLDEAKLYSGEKLLLNDGLLHKAKLEPQEVQDTWVQVAQQLKRALQKEKMPPSGLSVLFCLLC